MSVSGPWAPTPEGVRCELVDGKTAARHEVYALLRDGDAALDLSYTNEDGVEQRWNWPLSHLRHVEGQSGLKWGKVPFGVYTNVLTPTARLYVRDAHLCAALEELAPNLTRKAPVSGKGRLAALIAGAVASVGVIVFMLIPLIADQLAAGLPVEGERALGDKTYQQVRDSLGAVLPVNECSEPNGVMALEQMERKLLAVSDLDRAAVELTVLDHDMINAFALPGGRIVVMRGLIDAAETPEEVAAVIAHEMGHVAHRDPTRHALRSVGTFGVLSLVFGDFAGGTVVLLGVNQLVNAQYSQGAESAADAYAHALLPKAGVSPGALAPLFERLKEEYGDSEGLASHLASHPKLGDRVARAEEAAEGFAASDKPFLSPLAWHALQTICGDTAKDTKRKSNNIAP
ncbi:M48 family metallopeptidase [Celeribacter sp. ULVN23_4]